MAEVKYQKDTQRFDFLGLDLNRPVDSIKPGRLPFAQNIRSFLAGRIEPRDGIVLQGTPVVGQVPHSGRKLNDPAFSGNQAFIGSGTHLAKGPLTPVTAPSIFFDIDSGYSGNPLAMVPWKPVSSPKSFMYIGDSARMRKVDVFGSIQTIGLPAPANGPTVTLTNAPVYKDIETFQGAAPDGFTGGGSTASFASFSRTPGNGGAAGSTTTIAAILYDGGAAPGWAMVSLAITSGVTRGERLIFNGGGGTEAAIVQDVYPGGSGITIASILYDSGNTGPCSIQLSNPAPALRVNSFLNDTTTPTFFRCLGITNNPNGTTSIRANVPNTLAGGDTIVFYTSVRVYLNNTHVAASTVQCDGLFITVNKGVGYATKAVSIDLTQLNAATPEGPNDYISFGMIVDHPERLIEAKIQFDVDAADGATTGFTKNFYWRAIRPSDLTQSIVNNQSLQATRQTLLQNGILNAPQSLGSVANTAIANQIASGVVVPASQASVLPLVYQQVNVLNKQISQQATAGVNQWSEIRFRVSDLQRAGGDTSRTLANVANIQFVINCSGTVILGLSGLWIGGGFGPDTFDSTAIPYYYRYRARVFATNVPSSWSPAARYSLDAYRQSATITAPQYPVPSGTSFAVTDFVIDVYRYGGQLTDWHYIGTTSNSSPISFTDVYPDSTVAGQPIQGYTDFQLWPIKGLPVSGTTTATAGTTVQDSATNFNLSWAPGTRIIISNQPYTIYRVISTSLLETVESTGNLGVVTWQIPEPTLLAQPLRSLWVLNNVFFGLGDNINPGRLYYSNVNSENTTPSNYLDITPPSVPLQNGLAFNLRSYIFSTEGFIQLLETNDPTNPYRAEHIPNGKGLWSPWAMNDRPAPAIFFLAKDGIYMTTGGAPIPLTDADLYELFPNEANAGVAVNGVSSPNLALNLGINVNSTTLRMTYYDEYLYLDYLGQDNRRATLLLNFDLGASQRGDAPGGWMWDIYTPGMIARFGDEGVGSHALYLFGSDGNIYSYGKANDDAGTAITCSFTTPFLDHGTPRSFKYYGDIMIDCDTQGINVSCTPVFNSNTGTSNAITVNTVGRTQTSIPAVLITSSNIFTYITAKNIGLFVTFNTLVNSTARPLFYIWEPRYTFESAPISAQTWSISPTTFGMVGFKHFGICKITYVSTSPLILAFIVDNIAQPLINLPSSGGANTYKESIFRVPVMKGKLFQVAIGTGQLAEFRLDTRNSFLEVKDWGQDTEYQKLRIFGDYSMVEG